MVFYILSRTVGYIHLWIASRLPLFAYRKDGGKLLVIELLSIERGDHSPTLSRANILGIVMVLTTNTINYALRDY